MGSVDPSGYRLLFDRAGIVHFKYSVCGAVSLSPTEAEQVKHGKEKGKSTFRHNWLTENEEDFQACCPPPPQVCGGIFHLCHLPLPKLSHLQVYWHFVFPS